MLSGKGTRWPHFIAFLTCIAVLPLAAQEEAPPSDADEPDAVSAPAMELPPLPASLAGESPSTLFRLGGEAETELTLNGTWRASLSSEPVLNIQSRLVTWSFAGSPLLFNQSPDLYLRLVVNGSWFLEAAFAQTLGESSFALGYTGGEGSLIKEIRAGNRGLGSRTRPFLDLGASGSSSFGLGASFGSAEGAIPGFGAQALIRFDSVTPEKVLYIGYERVVEMAIPAGAFTVGKRFALPDTGVANLAAYLRAASGSPGSDGFAYAPLSPSAYGYSLSAGTVEFDSPLRERCLVAYDRADASPISSADAVSIDGRAAIPIFDPGRRSGYEILSFYELVGSDSLSGSSISVSIESTEHGNLDTAFGARISSDGTSLEVFRSGETDIRSESGRMPFFSLDPAIYEPGAARARDSSISIRITARQRKERLEIDPRAIPGTIRLWRDGTIESGFVYAPGSGYVELAVPPGEGQRIEIQYLIPASRSPSSDFVAEMAFDYFISESLSAYAALGTRWSMPNAQASGPETLTPGTAGLSAGLAWKADSWSAGIDLGLRYDRADSRDACRVDGMEDFIRVQDADEGMWIRGGGSEALIEIERADLYYRDFRRRDAFGIQRLASLESGFAPEAEDPASRQGPYPVADSLFGKANVAEFRLGQDGKTWCGVQARLDEALLAELPLAESIVIPLRYISREGSAPAFTLQAGMLGKSPFDDSPEVSMLADHRYSSPEFTLPSPPSEEWLEYEIPIDGDFSAGIRSGASITLILSSATLSSGLCVIGDIRLKGAEYQKRDGASRDRLSLEQVFSGGPEADFPAEVANIRGSIEGNAYLRMEVVANAGTPELRASKAFPVLPAASYRALAFFFRSSPASGTGASLSLEFADTGGVFLSVSLPLGEDAQWGEATLDFDTGAGWLRFPNGVSLPLAARVLRNQVSAGAVMNWVLSGVETGRIEVDELAFFDSRSTLSGLARFAASKEKTGSILSVGGIEILSGLEASSSADLALGKDSLAYSAQASAGIGIFPFRLSAAASAAGSFTQGSGASAPVFKIGHVLSLPFSFGSVESSFSQDGSHGDYARKEALRLGLPPVELAASAAANQNLEKLSQSWKASLSAQVLTERLRLENAWESDIARPNPLLGYLYFPAWMESYASFLPREDGYPLKRGMSLGAFGDSEREKSRSHRDAGVFASSSFQAGIEPLLSAEYGFTLKPLIAAGKNGMFRLIPEYSRRSSLSRNGASASFSDDLRFLGEGMSSLPSAWRGIPFGEFFDSRALNELRGLATDPVSAIQEATTGLAFERDAFLGLRDLLVPSLASYSLTRKTERVGSLESESLSHGARIGLRAVDLFGSRGALSLTRAFSTDEYSLDQRLTLVQNVYGAQSSYQYSAQLGCLFGFTGKNTLEIRDDVRLSSGEERVAESLSALLSLSREAGEPWEALRAAAIAWARGRQEAGSLDADSPMARAWLETMLDRTDSFGAGFSLSVGADGNIKLAAPLSYEFALSAENAMRLSAGARLRYGWEGVSGLGRSELALALSIQALLEF